MNRVRTIFTEPFWSIILPLTSLVFLFPVTLRSPIYEVSSNSKLLFSEPLSQLLKTSISEYLISCICISSISFMLNRLINAHGLIIKVSHFPALVTSFVGSILIVNFGWSSSYLALSILLIGIFTAVNLKREGRSEHVLFSTGLFSFLAVTVEPVLIFLVPLILTSFYLIRTLSIRELFVFLSSSIVLLIILFTGVFITKGDILTLENVFDLSMPVSKKSSPSEWRIIPLLFSIVTGVFGIFSASRILQSITNREKDLMRFLVIVISGLMIFSGVSYWLFQEPNSWSYLTFFTSFFLSVNFIFLKGKWLRIIYFILFLAFLSWSIIFFYNNF